MVRKSWEEFKEFLKEYKVLTVAIAFVMGVAVNDLVKSFVNNIFMPLLNPLIRGGAWETATFSMGPIELAWGAFMAALLNFIILAFIIFIIIKKIMKKPKKEKV